jgi:NAD(P)-dependent dehydrogenase (short-subunit alcohol dehydrogenase family)
MTTQQPQIMGGKTCLVTGATSGIGKATALGLARMGGEIIIVSRNSKRCQKTVDFIQKETGNHRVTYFAADLSSQSEIHNLVYKIKSKHPRLNVLVNNVGVMWLRRLESVDGIEMTFAVNHLSYFVLTNLLLDILKSSTPARIVNVSSNSHYGKPLNFDDLQLKRWYHFLKAYGRSKMANVLFTYALASRLEGTGVTANALHPGFVHTEMGKDNGSLVRWLYPLITRKAIPVEEGAENSIYMASSTEVEGVTGKYFVKRKSVDSDPASYDVDAQQRLWEISAALTGLT